MTHRTLYRFGIAALLLSLLSGPTRAETLDLHSNDGPIRLHIDHDGDVHGEYPQHRGVLHGHVDRDGTIHGVWLQPTSDHPCPRMHGDTYSWGAFRISDLHRRHVEGSWGYCDEQPTRDWEIERD